MNRSLSFSKIRNSFWLLKVSEKKKKESMSKRMQLNENFTSAPNARLSQILSFFFFSKAYFRYWRRKLTKRKAGHRLSHAKANKCQLLCCAAHNLRPPLFSFYVFVFVFWKAMKRWRPPTLKFKNNPNKEEIDKTLHYKAHTHIKKKGVRALQRDNSAPDCSCCFPLSWSTLLFLLFVIKDPTHACLAFPFFFFSSHSSSLFAK